MDRIVGPIRSFIQTRSPVASTSFAPMEVFQAAGSRRVNSPPLVRTTWSPPAGWGGAAANIKAVQQTAGRT
ncbi:MAG: hypothetical protein NTW28_26675 [Candidatus Solibacter sp.]|nr:hypothetical protein [Candidatus Solibacter sp.]